MKVELLGMEISSTYTYYGFHILSIETANKARNLFSVYFNYDVSVLIVDILFFHKIIHLKPEKSK
jgi:hypothetical protein